ncbi:class I SAM-dependent methyltransferase [Noviherbaspirillum galbum]|uniref:Class I SAM-dependent methyltransferase n=1 Tax=Noviherbaspirillum galbum TaxID=2709383 RepID=A0A6B3SP09_9BURK|nr:class I SAM-dependent methyltransferase [Noviherbaspirillum galbum]NEX62554.1 class I SAM-dependent methyltransferase [Noviherbaspirillum galbum]
MASSTNDAAFAGSIPQIYDRYLVPLIFKPYAADIAERVAGLQPGTVLEIAAGTGVVTRQLARYLPPAVTIVATDLNPPMLNHAAAIGTARPVEWRQADAMRLPFDDESMDVIVCQFGAMFFPDKAKAFAEARRVLRPGGKFVFNVWDGIEHNEFADVITEALVELFPTDPPRFLARSPHGYHDLSVIADDLKRGGFAGSPEFSTLSARSRADSPDVPAIAYCQGSPLRSEIEARMSDESDGLENATILAERALAERFGAGPIDGKIQAHVITVSA